MAKKAVAKKSSKSTKSSRTTKVDMMPTMTAPMPQSTTASITSMSPKLPPKLLAYALVVVAFALLTYKFGPYFVPAMVGNSPVTRFEVWSRLESSYGAQTLDDLVNEKILDTAIAKSGVKVDQAKVDEQIKNLETQFESMGGLDAALEQRGMKRTELVKQVNTQLAVEEILKDKVVPSEDAIKAAYEAGKTTTYKDKSLADVQDQIKEELTQTKLVESFRDWFEMIKAESKVKNFGL